MLGSLLKQALMHGYVSTKIERKILSSCGNGTQAPGEEKLLEMLYLVLRQCADLFVILDGLDECDRTSHDGLFQLPKCLELPSSPVVKVLLTCRDEDPILQSLSHYRQIQVSATALATDIALYITFSVRQRIESGDLKTSNPALEPEIIDELTTKAQGMYISILKLGFVGD